MSSTKQSESQPTLLTPLQHRQLNRWARRFFPVLEQFPSPVHRTFMEAEGAPEAVFRRPGDPQPLYEQITRTAVLAVKAEQVATFLGRRLTNAVEAEVDNDYSTRIQGTRIRHHLGPASIKLYDKFGRIARVECTTNDVTFFKHHRTVVQRNGRRAFKLAPLRKSIYSLPHLRELMAAANARYLEFIASIDNPDADLKAIDHVSKPARSNGRSLRGFNFLLQHDYQLFFTLAAAQWAITGFRAADLRAHLTGVTPSRTSYLLKRLRTHGLIK